MLLLDYGVTQSMKSLSSLDESLGHLPSAMPTAFALFTNEVSLFFLKRIKVDSYKVTTLT